MTNATWPYIRLLKTRKRKKVDNGITIVVTAMHLFMQVDAAICDG